MAPDQPLPGDVAWREGRWFRLGRWWGRTHYILGISAVIAPILASTAKKGSLQVSMTVIAAVCAALITFLQPSKKSDGYWRAWRHLDAAIRRYRSGYLQREDLNQAIDEGEVIVESSSAMTPPQKHHRTLDSENDRK